MNVSQILDKIKEVEGEVKSLSPSSVTLCLATKTQSKQLLMQLAEESDRPLIYADNRVQELIANYFEHPNVQRHFIGTLQTNKVKYIIDKVSLIQSVDRISLAEEINRQAKKIGITMDVLIEVSIANELSKGGVAIPEMSAFCKEMSGFSNIIVKGIMTMLPLDGTIQQKTELIKNAYSLFDNLKELGYDNFNPQFFSCGMSGDYRLAVSNGANVIRLGTRIFGERR